MSKKVKNTWEVYDRFYNCHWMVTGFSCRKFCQLLKQARVKNPEFLALMKKDVNSMCFRPKQFEQAATYFTNKTIIDTKWRKLKNKEFLNAAKKLWGLGESLRLKNFFNISNTKLTTLLSQLIKYHEVVRILGVTHNGIILDSRNHLSNEIKTRLVSKIGEKNYLKYWSVLSKPTKPSLRQNKEHELYKLKKTYKNNPPERKLISILDKYAFLDYMYYGPAQDIQSLKQEYLAIAAKNPYQELLRLKKQQLKIFKTLKLSGKAKSLIALSQEILWYKGYRKDVEYHAFWCYEPLMRLLARRNGHKNWRDLFYLLPWELNKFINFRGPKIQVLKQRRNFSIFAADEKSYELISGKAAKKLYKKTDFAPKQKTTGKELKGLVAFSGKAVGAVRLIFTAADMEKMRQGDILVSQATSPNLLPAMKKSAAIVTNTGGLICHAAITARELKIPCIVGTIHATRVFKDGDIIEVDANNGIVKKL